MNLQQCCRLCLSEKQLTFDIYKSELRLKGGISNLAETIIVVSGIEIAKDEVFSNNICFSCHYTVTRFYEFRQKCIESNVKFLAAVDTFKENEKSKEVVNSIPVFSSDDEELPLVKMKEKVAPPPPLQIASNDSVHPSVTAVIQKYPGIILPTEALFENLNCKIILQSLTQLFFAPKAKKEVRPPTSDLTEENLHLFEKASNSSLSVRSISPDNDEIVSIADSIEEILECWQCHRRFNDPSYLKHHIEGVHKKNTINKTEAIVLLKQLPITTEYDQIVLTNDCSRASLLAKNTKKIIELPKDASIRKVSENRLSFKTLNGNDGDMLLQKLLQKRLSNDIEIIENEIEITDNTIDKPESLKYNHELRLQRMLKNIDIQPENDASLINQNGLCQQYLPHSILPTSTPVTFERFKATEPLPVIPPPVKSSKRPNEDPPAQPNKRSRKKVILPTILDNCYQHLFVPPDQIDGIIKTKCFHSEQNLFTSNIINEKVRKLLTAQPKCYNLLEQIVPVRDIPVTFIVSSTLNGRYDFNFVKHKPKTKRHIPKQGPKVDWSKITLMDDITKPHDYVEARRIGDYTLKSYLVPMLDIKHKTDTITIPNSEMLHPSLEGTTIQVEEDPPVDFNDFLSSIPTESKPTTQSIDYVPPIDLETQIAASTIIAQPFPELEISTQDEIIDLDDDELDATVPVISRVKRKDIEGPTLQIASVVSLNEDFNKHQNNNIQNKFVSPAPVNPKTFIKLSILSPSKINNLYSVNMCNAPN